MANIAFSLETNFEKRCIQSYQTVAVIKGNYSQNGSYVPLTSKLCAEVWKTGYECSLNPGNENSKLEMGTPKFPAKIDFNFHWKSSSLQIETSDVGPDFLFSFLNSTQPTGWIF